MSELRAELEKALALYEGPKKRVSSSLNQLPKISGPGSSKVSQAQVSSYQRLPVSETQVSANVMSERVSQNRVPVAKLSGQRIPLVKPPVISSRRPFKSRIAAFMPRFAKICIVLAVVVVLSVVAQIIGDYVKTNPLWSQFLHPQPEYSAPEQQDLEKKRSSSVRHKASQGKAE